MSKNELAYSEGGDPAVRAGLLLTMDKALNNQRRYKFESEHPLIIDTERPAVWSWRNANGMDYSTPVRDQGATYACVAFGLISALECDLKKGNSSPDFVPNLSEVDRKELLEKGPDLSEADLFFKRDKFGVKNGGWFIEDAILRARNHGICLEKYFPFDPKLDDNVKIEKDEDESLPRVHLASAYKTCDLEVAKTLLWLRGPLLAGIDYRGSLCSYRNKGSLADLDGLEAHYDKYTFGDPEIDGQGHLVAIMGYQDLSPEEAKKAECKGFWLVKNSWGKDWGYEGWCKVPYSESPLGQSTLGVKTGFFSVSLCSTPVPLEEMPFVFLERLEVFIDSPGNVQKLQDLTDKYMKKGGVPKIRTIKGPLDGPPN